MFYYICSAVVETKRFFNIRSLQENTLCLSHQLVSRHLRFRNTKFYKYLLHCHWKTFIKVQKVVFSVGKHTFRSWSEVVCFNLREGGCHSLFISTTLPAQHQFRQCLVDTETRSQKSRSSGNNFIIVKVFHVIFLHFYVILTV